MMQEDEEEFGPVLPSRTSYVPDAKSITLGTHSKPLNALALDSSGSRLLTGSMDQTVAFWDFAGMDSSCKPFRVITPEQGHAVNALQFSESSDRFLSVTSSPQPIIFDREGIQLETFVRGDMYLKDLKHTKGHISGCTGGFWNPLDNEEIVTFGTDGTVRIWNVNKPMENLFVIKSKSEKALAKIPVSACAMSFDGSTIATGEGLMKLYDSS